jgi:hypothetical protein
VEIASPRRKIDSRQRRGSDGGLSSPVHWPRLRDHDNRWKGFVEEMEYLDDLIEDDVKKLTPKDSPMSPNRKL